MIFDQSPQGSPEWLQIRKGKITGSRAKDARDCLKSGAPSKAQTLYAQDVARERIGGKANEVYVNAAMRFGQEQEPIAREAYEIRSGNIVLEAGFAYTEDGLFGCSVDGLVGDDGMVEIKTMVSSDTLFTAVVDGDNSAYIDQINFSLWLLGLKWCDLILWAPDLEGIGRHLTIRRIERDDDVINALEADMVKFARTVKKYEDALRQPLVQPEEVAA